MWKRYKGRVFLFYAVGLLSFLAYVLRRPLLLIWVAAVLAIILTPVVDWIRRWPIPHWHPSRGAATLLLALLVLIVIGVFGIVAVPRITSDARQLQQQWPRRSAELDEWMHQHVPFGSHVSAQQLEQRAKKLVGANFAHVSSEFVDLLITLLVAGYFIVDGPQVFDWLVSLVPAPAQPRFRATLTRGGHRTQRWLAGQGLLMLIHGVSATIAFGLIGLKYFYLLGVFAGIINIIPVLGPILTLVVAGMVAAIHSTGKLIGVIVFYLLYHNAENVFLSPRIMESKVRIPAATVVVALVIGDGLAGFVGMLISVPTAVLIAKLVNEYIAHHGILLTEDATPAPVLPQADKAA